MGPHSRSIERLRVCPLLLSAPIVASALLCSAVLCCAVSCCLPSFLLLPPYVGPILRSSCLIVPCITDIDSAALHTAGPNARSQLPTTTRPARSVPASPARTTSAIATMNVNKKFGRFKQWAGEKMGAEARTGTSDEFRALEMEMELRHEGMQPTAALQPLCNLTGQY